MDIIPAIDVLGGRCVRLYQGDYDKQTVYSDDPAGVALYWEKEGASRIHVVDLDGAASGNRLNLAIIGRIAKGINIPIQVGGGIRDLTSAEELLGIGVSRIIMGTSAIEQPGLVKQACLSFGAQAVVIGVDARDGMVALRGWREVSSVKVLELVDDMIALGVNRIIYTDIYKDGTLTEPNFDAIEELVNGSGVSVIASGGISSIDHLKRLRDLGAEGAIIGMALYTGAINLEEAIAAV